MIRKGTLYLLVSLVALTGFETRADETEGGRLSFSVEDSTNPRVGDEKISVMLLASSTTGISISEVTAEFTGPPRAFYDKTNCEIMGQGNIDLGSSLPITCGFQGHFDTLGAQISKVFVPASEYKLLVRYKRAADSANYSSIVDLKVAAPVSSVFAGGVAGSILCVIILALTATLRQQRRTETAKRPFRARNGKELVYFALRGGLVAICLIYISKVATGSAVPIAVDIKDFYGGIVVGLFSIPLSEWVSDILSGGSLVQS